MIVTVLAVLALASLFLFPSAVRQVGRHGLWTIGNLSNFFIWQNFGGYWGDAAESAPLLHTWSLAVEEQFHLLFPTSLILLARFQRNRVTGWLLAATALSLGLCLYATPRHAAASFYMLPTRVWELLLGGVLASYRIPLRKEAAPSVLPNPVFEEAIGWAGLALIFAGFFTIDEAGGFPGAIALIPTIGTLLVLISVGGTNRVSQILSTPFLVNVGKLSYSLYLWHWPLITIGKSVAKLYGRPPLVGAVTGALLSIVLACGAFLYIEKPLRSRGPGRPWRLATVATGFLIVLVTSSWVANSRRLDTARYFDRLEFHGLLYSAGKVTDSSKAIRYQDVQFPSLKGHDDDAWKSGGVIHKAGQSTPAVVVLGSSHALMYSRLIDSICRRLGLSVAFFGIQGAPVFFNASTSRSFPTTAESREFDAARRRWLQTWRPQAVFVIDRWDLYVDGSDRFEVALRTFLRELSPLTKRLFFVSQIPVVADGGDDVNLRELMAWRMQHSNSLPQIFPDAKQPERKRAITIATAAMPEFPNMSILRPDLTFLKEDNSVRWISGRTVYYADDDHLADAGTELVRGLFENAILQATSTASGFRLQAANAGGK